jgi:hypothetical protein
MKYKATYPLLRAAFIIIMAVNLIST